MLLKYLAPNIRRALEKIDLTEVEEIRLRADKPIVLEIGQTKQSLAYHPTQKEITETLELMSEQSIYAFMEEIKNGFLTLTGGHRVGICGRVIIKHGEITNITQISGLNIRIAKEKKGIAEEVVPLTKNTLLISPPNCGKTTLLRDIARVLSKDKKVAIIDERGEIAGMHKGQTSYDIGINSDVLDLCPKAIGMIMMVRSMSPEILIVDEIGNKEDFDAIKFAGNSGVQVIATAHGNSIVNVMARMPNITDYFTEFIIITREKGKFHYDKITWNRANSNNRN